MKLALALLVGILLSFPQTSFADWGLFYRRGAELPAPVYQAVKDMGVYRYQWTEKFNCQDFSRKFERLFNEKASKEPALKGYKARFTAIGMLASTTTYRGVAGYKEYNYIWLHAIVTVFAPNGDVYVIEPQSLSKDAISLDFTEDNTLDHYRNMPRKDLVANPPNEGGLAFISVFDSWEKADKLGWKIHDSRPFKANENGIKKEIIEIENMEKTILQQLTKYSCEKNVVTCDLLNEPKWDEKLQVNLVVTGKLYCKFQSENCVSIPGEYENIDATFCPEGFGNLIKAGAPVGYICQKPKE